MIRCEVYRGSKAAGRLPTAARRFNSTTISQTPASSSINNASANPLPDLRSASAKVAVPSIDPDSQTASPSRREYVASNYKPSPRPNLPLSPLMDPSSIEARSRHHLRKARPVPKELTPFQNQLRQNPYALALATPVRMCSVTRTTLPNFFLQDFKLLAHPETGEPWWMPSGLARKGKKLREVEEEEGNGLGVSGSGEKIEQDGDRLPVGDTKGKSTHSKSADGKRLLGPAVYTIARKEFLHALSNKKKIGYSTDFQKQFIDAQLLKNASSRQLASEARWRVDIDEFLLDLMRRRVIEDLTSLLRVRKGYIVGCKSWDDALAKPQVGAYLWIGKEGEVHPPEFATLDLGATKKKKIPTHNLQLLLGVPKLDELRARFDKIFDNNILALKHRRRTVDVEMMLWKIQGYLAEYKDSLGGDTQ